MRSSEQERPNILFIFADQLQAFTLGCMGNSECQTPNLDRMAEKGVLFKNAYSAAPVCTPFRGTLLSGRYGSQTGIMGNGPYFQPDEWLLPECLNEHGYRTSYVGKWHLGGQGNIPVPEGRRAGFTDFIGYQCYNSFLANVWFFDEQERRYEYASHRTEATAQVAIERLQGMRNRQPWCMFISYQNPHYPVEPSPEYKALYENADVTLRPNSQEEIDPYTATFNPFTGLCREEDPVNKRYGNDMREYVREYYALVTQMDHEIGRLFDALEELGYAENTVVFFTADHGDMQGSHGELNKGQFYEESSKIPLIVSGSGVVEGQIADEPVDSVDFFPTILDLAEAPRPGTSEGVSFVSRLQKGDPLQNKAAFVEPLKGNCVCIREGVYKFVADKEDYTPLFLFDLDSDPYELQNLVEAEGYQEVRDRLLERLKDWHQGVQQRIHPVVKEQRQKKDTPKQLAGRQPWTNHGGPVSLYVGDRDPTTLLPNVAKWFGTLDYENEGCSCVDGFWSEYDKLVWEIHAQETLNCRIDVEYTANSQTEGCCMEIQTAPLCGLALDTAGAGGIDQVKGTVPLQKGRNTLCFRLAVVPGVYLPGQRADTGFCFHRLILKPTNANCA